MNALDNDDEGAQAEEDVSIDGMEDGEEDAWDLDEETLAQLEREGLLVDEGSNDDLQVCIWWIAVMTHPGVPGTSPS